MRYKIIMMSWERHHWLYYSSIFLEESKEITNNLWLGDTVVKVRIRWVLSMCQICCCWMQPATVFILKYFLHRWFGNMIVFTYIFWCLTSNCYINHSNSENLQYEFSEHWVSCHKWIWDEIEVVPVKCRTDMLGAENCI
jgi:hypothetical protein